MIPLASQRLDLERCLLAALFLWPREVDIPPRCWTTAEHSFLFRLIQEAGFWLLDVETAIPAMRVLLERDIDATSRQSHPGVREREVARLVRAYEDYIIMELLPIEVTAHAIDDLVEQMKECPRCGR